MPKVSIQVGARVRIDCNYDDYKGWEKILGTGAKESTTFTEDGYWKSLYFKIGETEYRIGGPFMPKAAQPQSRSEERGTKD